MFAATKEATLGETYRREGKRVGVRETYRRVGVSACRRERRIVSPSGRKRMRIGGCKVSSTYSPILDHLNALKNNSSFLIRRYADTILPDPIRSPRVRPLKIEFVHIFFGAIDPTVSKDDFVVYQADLFVTRQAKVHPIGDLLAVQDHDGDLIHQIACD
jgi:hypothetical protein